MTSTENKRTLRPRKSTRKIIIRTTEEKVLEKVDKAIKSLCGNFEKDILKIIGEFTDINQKKGKLCKGCNITVIMANNPDCMDIGVDHFCKNCYFQCADCNDIGIKEERRDPNYYSNDWDFVDKYISNNCCKIYDDHIDKFGELRFCEDCMSEKYCGCDCGEIMLCSCEDTVICDECNLKVFSDCSNDLLFWCENCEEIGCGECRTYYNIGNGYPEHNDNYACKTVGSCCMKKIS